MRRRYYPQMLLCAVVVILAMAGCTDARPGRPPTVDPQPRSTPIPLPGVFPLRPGNRSISAPVAPVAESGLSYVTNTRLYRQPAGTYLLGSDFVVAWSHEDPLSVDYFEVWRATDEAYWSPETCAGCSLAATSTGLSEYIYGSPPAFNPVAGTANADIASGIDFYLVRGVNAAGESADSNMIGVVNYSLQQDRSGMGGP